MAVIVDINHETGDLTEYTSTSTDGGHLSAAAGAALAGTSYGLNCYIADTTAMYGQATVTTNTSGKLRFRFHFDPNSLANAGNFTFDIIRAYSSTNAVLLNVAFYKSSGAYGFQVSGRDDANAAKFLSPTTFAVSDEPHYFEIYLTRASTADANDGTLTVWMDGTSKGTLTTLDNNGQFGNFSYIRFGAGVGAGITSGTSGNFFYDEIVANDDGGEIGPKISAYTITAAAGAFTLTGIAAGLAFAGVGIGGSPRGLLLALTHTSYGVYSISAGTGTFTLTGRPTGLLAALKLVAAYAEFTETGQAANLLMGHRLNAETGSFALTGNDAGLNRVGINTYTLTAATGSFNLAGLATGLRAARKMTAASLALTLTGNAASLRRGFYLGAGFGAFTFTGQAVGWLRGYVMPVGAGAFTLTGLAASFVYSPAGAYSMRADPAAYALTGIDVGLLRTYILAAALGTFTLTGINISFVTGLATETPAARVYVIGAETRVYIVPAEERIYKIV